MLWWYCYAHPTHILDLSFCKIKSKYKWRKYWPHTAKFFTKHLLKYLAYLPGGKADAPKHLSIAEILRFLKDKMVYKKKGNLSESAWIAHAQPEYIMFFP